MIPALDQDRRSDYRAARLLAESAVASFGVALVATALLANQRWLDRHFLPSFFLTRQTYVLLETIARFAIGVLGVSLALVVRPRLGRVVARTPARVLHVRASRPPSRSPPASWCSVACSLRPAEWLGRDQEPRRQADPRLGWTFVPSRTGHGAIGGRVVDYTFDSAGYRVRRADEPVDPERPTILFTGESVMFGKGLTWEESVPAQVGAMLGKQSANLAVDGYGNDQAYLQGAGRAATFSSAGGGGRHLHDDPLRPQPGRRPTAPWAGTGVAARRHAWAAAIRSRSWSRRTAAMRPSSAASR